MPSDRPSGVSSEILRLALCTVLDGSKWTLTGLPKRRKNNTSSMGVEKNI